MNRFSQLLKVTLGTVWLSLNTDIFLSSSFAVPKSFSSQISQVRSSGDWISLGGDPPPNGAGTRTPCDGEVVALVPIAEQGNKKYYAGYTAQPLPTFRFSVPYKPEIIESSKLLLRYPGGSIETNLKITAPGIIQVALPASKIKELAIGQWYQVELQITASCRKDKPPQFITSSFWIKRRSLSSPLNSNLTPQQQIDRHKKEQMWFEALDVAIGLERKKPGNRDWQELLSSAGLKEQVNQPILDCCSSPQSRSQMR